MPFISTAKVESSAGCKYISTVEDTMEHTGAGRASCVGSGGRVSNLAEYWIQLPESATQGCYASINDLRYQAGIGKTRCT